MHRTIRKLTAMIAIAAVLLSQLAVSAHACPMHSAAGAVEMALAMASGPDSDASTTADPPSLCQKHCQNDQQNRGDPPAPLASVAPAPSFIVTLPATPATGSAGPTPLPALQHSTSPPLTIRNCCFRI